MCYKNQYVVKLSLNMSCRQTADPPRAVLSEFFAEIDDAFFVFFFRVVFRVGEYEQGVEFFRTERLFEFFGGFISPAARITDEKGEPLARQFLFVFRNKRP